eukprot:GFUD01015157.1.p1 GENE.GFUD01015157.1~~GFUD01015157.1.p1  ORF type:complete len:296 (+),score=126.86 GFUD01015157.1:58-945(+)
MAAPAGKHMERVKSLDLYLLLEVEQDADTKTIKKAYRKKALTCHPDKNPDNKKAVDLFHQLSDALEVLADDATRLAYDNLLKARKAAELRTRQLDGKRRKLKEQLEEREKTHTEELVTRYNEEDTLAKEINRLRKEGSRQLEEEQEAMKKQMREERLGQTRVQEEQVGGRVKVKWDKRSDCQYNKDTLERIFLKYGTVIAIVINEKKGGSALVEFDSLPAARMAVNIETGFVENRLKVKPLWEEKVQVGAGGGGDDVTGGAAGGVSSDFESLVMRKLRQEEERKRLIQKIMEEES